MLKDNVYTKNLLVLGAKDLKRVIIVDNVSANFSSQKDNGIEIVTWFKEMTGDKELVKLEKMLIGFQMLEDVRVGIRKVGGKIIGDE